MAVVVNSGQPTNSDTSSGNNFLMGAVILIVLAVLFIVYILPRIGTGFGTGTGTGVPNSADVNINTPK